MEFVKERVQQIRLENAAFEGQNNAYVLAGREGPTTIVDTGVDVPDVEAQLRSGLEESDLSFADVERIFLTHFHLDHSGLAARIQEESGAPVFGHPDDIRLVGTDGDARELLEGSYGRGIDAWHVPPDKREVLESHLTRARDHAGGGVDATPVDTGTSYDTGAGPITPVPLPGHTLGHVGYALPDGELLAGDALLPVYTPNIGGADPRVTHPLETYLDTLTAIVDHDPPRVWPGHRDVIEDPGARVREIYAHHRERTARVVAALSTAESMTPWDVAVDLFGSLSSIHILHGPGEAFAHLDHLVQQGVADVEAGRFRLVDPDVDPDRIVPPFAEATQSHGTRGR